MILKGNLSLNRYEWAAEKITELAACYESPVSLFDIGSRDNVLKQYITSNSIDYNAFDLNPLDITAKQWDIEKPLPYNNHAAQIITMLEVVEHLKNPWLCIKNIADTIDPGGHLILTTPNPTWSHSRVDLFTSGYLSCFSQSDLDLNHHVFTPWPHIISRLLTDSGFEIMEYYTLDGKTKIFDKNLKGLSMPVKLASRIVKKMIELRDPTSCGMSYGIIAKKIG